MLKLSLLAFTAAALCPALASADATPPAPGTNPDTNPDTEPTPTTPVTGMPTAPATIPTVPAPPTTTSTTVTTTTAPPAYPAPAPNVAYTPDTYTTVSTSSYAWHDDALSSGIGIAAIVGGGISGFTDKTMRDTVSSDVSGLWDARLTIGSHVPIGLDVSYLGTATSLASLSGTPSATLVGTTVEGALRWNILPHAVVNPYIFGGVGWQRYDVTGRTVSLSDSGMNPSDNSIEFPMGAGIGYRDPSGLVFDLRGTFRANTDQGLVLEPGANPNSASSNNYAPMHTWEASAAVGAEF